MLPQIHSAAGYGMYAYEVELQINGAHGSPKIIIVGLPDTAVKESQDRVTTAIINSATIGRGDGPRSISRRPISKKKGRASICRSRSS